MKWQAGRLGKAAGADAQGIEDVIGLGRQPVKRPHRLCAGMSCRGRAYPGAQLGLDRAGGPPLQLHSHIACEHGRKQTQEGCLRACLNLQLKAVGPCRAHLRAGHRGHRETQGVWPPPPPSAAAWALCTTSSTLSDFTRPCAGGWWDGVGVGALQARMAGWPATSMLLPFCCSCCHVRAPAHPLEVATVRHVGQQLGGALLRQVRRHQNRVPRRVAWARGQ